MNELEQLLAGVKDSYNDFVLAMLDDAAKSDYRRDELLKYPSNNTDVVSSDVIKYVMVHLGLYNEYKNRKPAEALVS